jgi:hypothetical protein
MASKMDLMTVIRKVVHLGNPKVLQLVISSVYHSVTMTVTTKDWNLGYCSETR